MPLLETSPIELSSPFLVIYGDSLLRMDFKSLVEFHFAQDASLTLACHRPQFEAFLFEDGLANPTRTNFGIAELECDGYISRFEEKPLLLDIPSSFARPVANAAVYVVEPESLRDASCKSPANFDFAYDVIPQLVNLGQKVAGLDIAPGFRLDLGTLRHYLAFQLAVLKETLPINLHWAKSSGFVFSQGDVQVHSSARITGPVFLGQAVQIDRDVALDSSVIGTGTRIGAGASVRESIIMEDVTLGEGAIVEGSIVGSHSWIGPQIRVPEGTVTGSWSSIGLEDLRRSPRMSFEH